MFIIENPEGVETTPTPLGGRVTENGSRGQGLNGAQYICSVVKNV